MAIAPRSGSPALLVAVLGTAGLAVGALVAPAALARVAQTGAQAQVRVIVLTGAEAGSALTLEVGEVGPNGMTLVVRSDGGAGRGGASPAQIGVATAPGASFMLGMPATLNFGDGSIQVARFRSGLPLAAGTAVGHHDLAVGATIAIAPGTRPGVYAAPLELTIQNF